MGGVGAVVPCAAMDHVVATVPRDDALADTASEHVAPSQINRPVVGMAGSYERTTTARPAISEIADATPNAWEEHR
jgi:hypothetical protein